jgi:hypothetical protein
VKRLEIEEHEKQRRQKSDASAVGARGKGSRIEALPLGKPPIWVRHGDDTGHRPYVLQCVLAVSSDGGLVCVRVCVKSRQLGCSATYEADGWRLVAEPHSPVIRYFFLLIERFYLDRQTLDKTGELPFFLFSSFLLSAIPPLKT